MSDVPRVSIVIVGHNSSQQVSACLASIELQDVYKMDGVEILLVDSGSGDDTRVQIANSGIRTRFISTHRNLGFSRGNNWALRIARSSYLLLLNPDTELAAGALDYLIAMLDEHPDIGVAAPKLLFPDGSTQSSRRRLPGKLTALFESFRWQPWFSWLPIAQHFYMTDRDENTQHDVEWAYGAALLVRRAALSQAGLFDESFFMYSEETDLCKRIGDAGWRVVYFPESKVIHHEGKSSEKNLLARNLRFHGSRLRYYAKHHGHPWALLVRLATISHFAILSVEEALKFVATDRNRALRRQRISMYWKVLSSFVRGSGADLPRPL